MIARSLLLLLLATAVQARAGVAFDFATTLSGNEYSYSGRMFIDKGSSRTDITAGTHPLFNPNFSIITRRNGKEIVVVDHARRTYFLRRTQHMGGHLAAARGIGKTTAFKPDLRVERIDQGVRIHASYRLMMEIEGEKVPGTVALEVTVEHEAVPQEALPWGLQFAAKTGFVDIDEAIARRLPRRLPRRQIVSASRRIADGPLVTETITTTISNVTQNEADEELFLAPRGYRYEEPVFDFAR
ncbi:MAG TPA: hypothetical protein VNA69_22995 [Thermoanaerobaculia bacterium]|nr:hypothetical protein [Thermoanaerobaculia bacterium]